MCLYTPPDARTQTHTHHTLTSIQDLTAAEVPELAAILGGDQYVGRLHVQMDDPVDVDVLQCACDVLREAESPLRVQNLLIRVRDYLQV